jgi:hypothetical protein
MKPIPKAGGFGQTVTPPTQQIIELQNELKQAGEVVESLLNILRQVFVVDNIDGAFTVSFDAMALQKNRSEIIKFCKVEK